jgi:Lrp/AsnC family transcriptional regulator, regulator for asnA, asnC and gidA
MHCSNRNGGAVRLDSVDRGLVANLKLDGRMSYAELASRLGVSEGTARNRLTRLIEGGVVRIAPVVEPEPIGYRLNVWLGIRCHPGAARDAAAALRDLHPVRYVGICTGTYDLICEAIFLSEAELLGFLSTGLADVPGLVHVDTSTVLDIAKFGYEWELREEDVLPASRHRSA